jgi:hypothetical protein
LAVSAQLYAAEPAQPVPTDPDYLVQGEYVGEVAGAAGKEKLGVQVIARGEGKFHLVSYRGGLPGAGWKGGERRECDGQSASGVVTFKSGDVLLKFADGEITVERAGSAIGKLKKIVRTSPTLGAKPPQGAIVLFDGSTAGGFKDGRLTEDGLLMQGATSRAAFQGGTLHIEFRIPFDPQGKSRGNSGVYLQSRYEVQVLDSIGLPPHNHECGGIPSVRAPDVSMSLPSFAWQTYDVDFTPAQFRDGKKERHARMTVRHNGVVVHNDVEVPHATTSSPLPEGPEPGPLNLQEHGSQVRFRNIWFLERK